MNRPPIGSLAHKFLAGTPYSVHAQGKIHSSLAILEYIAMIAAAYIKGKTGKELVTWQFFTDSPHDAPMPMHLGPDALPQSRMLVAHPPVDYDQFPPNVPQGTILGEMPL